MREWNAGKLSKYLSFVLRHRPDDAGIELDPAGWTDVRQLLEVLRDKGYAVTREQLEQLVGASDKQRFAFSAGGDRIRANQGHSVEVDLELLPMKPPDELFHGTVEKFIDAIRREGLARGERHHVHLSEQRSVARDVGRRRGVPIVLVIKAGAMHGEGHLFYRSHNGVWLTEAVPPKHLVLPEG